MKKKYVIALISILAILTLVISFYVRNANNPSVEIEVIKRNDKEVISLDKPKITISKSKGIKPSVNIRSSLLDVEWAHENVFFELCYYYKGADVNLTIVEEKNKIILKYSGTVSKVEGESEPYKKEIKLDFDIEANIINYKR